MYRIEINRRTLRLMLYKDNILLKVYPVAVGKASTPTPAGHFKIIGKGLWGNQFGGHFMRLNIPNGIYGIHGTDLPASIGHSVSHGCVRMNSAAAAELYRIVPFGTPVNIY